MMQFEMNFSFQAFSPDRQCLLMHVTNTFFPREWSKRASERLNMNRTIEFSSRILFVMFFHADIIAHGEILLLLLFSPNIASERASTRKIAGGVEKFLLRSIDLTRGGSKHDLKHHFVSPSGLVDETER
jgi:hypothetical protein